MNSFDLALLSSEISPGDVMSVMVEPPVSYSGRARR
jgi:hypothetical protein